MIPSRLFALAGLVALAIVPWVLARHQLSLLTDLLIAGLFAMSLDLIMGYTGMVSFGHAAFFGMGAYVTGLTMLRFGLPVLPAMILGILGATVAAAVVGFFAIRLKSVYFALLTFAFSQIFYQIAITWTSFTGGFDGAALSMPMQVGPLNLRDRATLYFFVLALVLLCYLVAHRVVRSPFGTVLLGGMGTLWGPLVGGAAVVFLREWLSGVSLIGKHHLLPLGLIFVLLVIFAPNGLAGLLARRRQPLLGDPDAEPGELATPRPATQPLDPEPRL